MKRLLFIALALMIASVAVAQEPDTFGLWRMVDGDYENYLPVEDIPGEFFLYVTLHDGSTFSVGGYEVGMDIPAEMLVLEIDFFGGVNFGDNTNHLVGYTAPIFTQEDMLVLSVMDCLSTALPPAPVPIVYHGADPASIPGHDGPVYADGTNPDNLIACGYVDGTPNVFLFGGAVATESQSWSGVKSLFE